MLQTFVVTEPTLLYISPDWCEDYWPEGHWHSPWSRFQGATWASRLNLDLGVNDYFHYSSDEIFYSTVMLQPLTFQDDLNHMTEGVNQAQGGMTKIKYVFKEKRSHTLPSSIRLLAERGNGSQAGCIFTKFQ